MILCYSVTCHHRFSRTVPCKVAGDLVKPVGIRWMHVASPWWSFSDLYDGNGNYYHLVIKFGSSPHFTVYY